MSMKKAITFSDNQEKPECSLQEAMQKIWSEELYVCPVFYKKFEIGVILMEYTAEARISLEKMIDEMEGDEWEVKDYEAAAKQLEKCVIKMRQAGIRAKMRRGLELI